MSMTKKDYELLANTIKHERMNWKDNSGPVYGNEAVKALGQFAGHLADHLSRENERFDRDRFLSACGVTRSVDGSEG